MGNERRGSPVVALAALTAAAAFSLAASSRPRHSPSVACTKVSSASGSAVGLTRTPRAAYCSSALSLLRTLGLPASDSLYLKGREQRQQQVSVYV